MMPLPELTVDLVARAGGVALAAYVVACVVQISTTAVVQLPFDNLFALAQKRFPKNAQFPLTDKIAIVTGSTNGIGEQCAQLLYRMGCTVVIASRTHEKCLATAAKLASIYPTSSGKILTHILDTSDLDSVREFVKWFRKDYKQLHFLCNNAGIAYMPADPTPTPAAPRKSKQDYDKCFATNFLGHYLLTELLMPVLKATDNARVLVVASSAHLQVDGSALRSISSGGAWSTPEAARCDIYTIAHWITSYGNSKLAQLLHQSSLQKKIDADKAIDVKIISICPGFVATGMVPDSPLGRFLAKRFYPVEAAVNIPLYTLLCPDGDIKGGEFLTNFHNAWSSSMVGRAVYKISALLGLRSFLVGFIGIPWITIFQHTSYGVHHTPVSDVAMDEQLAESFDKWCQQAVKPFM